MSSQSESRQQKTGSNRLSLFGQFSVIAACMWGALIALATGFVSTAGVSLTAIGGWLWLALGLAAAGAAFGIRSVNGIRGDVGQAKNLMNDFMAGRYDTEINDDRHDEIGDLLSTLKARQVQLGEGIQASREREEAALQVQLALDKVQSAVMVADTDHKLIYANEAVTQMLADAAHDVRQHVSGFDAENLLGMDVSVFSDAPARFRDTLTALSSTHRSSLKMGGSDFSLAANPVVDKEGKRIGTAIEWRNVTEQVSAATEIQQLIAAASSGRLDGRLDIEKYSGFEETLSASINQLLGAVSKPMAENKRVVGALSNGDLTQTVQGSYDGDFGEMKSAVNDTIGRLSTTVVQIRETADSIGSAAKEISQGNADLSRRTETQAANLEETASSMEELTSTVKQNADNARQANQLAVSARELAEQGGDVVGNAVQAMTEITRSSSQIADIIGVIDEIAFQTNLLALNASVEAARAGDQGRGFAVVAGEVRSLAQRSATAAKEIKDLIQDSVKKVQEGSNLVDKSGATLEEIVTSVKKVTDIVGEIASASQEQATGIAQVNNAITQMDTSTQQNAALVEEAAAAGEALDEQAGALGKMLNFFRVDSAAATAPAAGSSNLDFSAARSKHLLWKSRIRRFLDGKESMDASQAVDHHSCDLGKWLDAEGMSKYNHLGEMQQLYDTHRDLHACIRDIVKHKHDGDDRAAEDGAEQLDKMSDEVVGLLTKVEKHAAGTSAPRSNHNVAPLRPANNAPAPAVPAAVMNAANSSAAASDADWEEF